MTNTKIEIWGGIESTVNRVNDVYFDQLQKTGHDKRLSDLDMLAELRIKRIRYPILWERIAPRSLHDIDWSWSDERIYKLRELNITPIAGLVHHGSGPSYTNLLDEEFPYKLAQYASQVAQRYPWLTYYTPINEPLTTARFSCLYALWYPHKKNNTRSFVRALINQYKGIVLAMEAIRKANPDAKLIQTEDLGKVYSIPELREQAAFDNERRWLTYDILSGKVTREHPMWKYLVDNGITEKEVDFFIEHKTSPNIIGINHYVTSERFLDTHIERYPPGSICHHDTYTYADVEAVRVMSQSLGGPYRIIKEAWERYKIPLAITEAHMGCTREEQLRWIYEFWKDGMKLRTEGVDLQAITIWSLFGVYDWDSLVTLDRGHYEPGAFDVRGGVPRPTAIATLVRELATAGKYEHEVLQNTGWWRRKDRHTYEPMSHFSAEDEEPIEVADKVIKHRPVIILGATGTLGQAFAKACDIRGLSYELFSRKDMDITKKDSITTALQDADPWAVINAAGYVRVDQAESECDNCMAVNAEGPATIAKVCNELNISFVTFSSDMVFDGKKQSPYLEQNPVHPLNVYGMSKAVAEKKVTEASRKALVIRTSAFFGPWDSYNFATQTVQNLLQGELVMVPATQVISPTYVPELTNTVLDLLIDNESGIWHLANQGEVTWKQFAEMLAQRYGIKNYKIIENSDKELGYIAKRPEYSVLGSSRGQLLSPLDEAVGQYINSMKHSKALKDLEVTAVHL